MENNIRLGKISAIDYAAGTVRVVYHEKDDAVTAPIPLISSEYFMPEVDDMVMVLHLSNGTEAGVVLGRPWSEKNKPPEGSKGLYRKDLGKRDHKGDRNRDRRPRRDRAGLGRGGRPVHDQERGAIGTNRL